MKRDAIRALIEMLKDKLPDGDRHTIGIEVRDGGGDLVLRVAVDFQVETENRSAANKSPDPHAEG